MPKKKARVWGPYKHGNGYRCAFHRDGKTRVTEILATREAAQRLRLALEKELELDEGLSVATALDGYERYLTAKGNKPSSIRSTLARLHTFFDDPEASIEAFGAKDAAAAYERLTAETSKDGRRRFSPDTHRNTLCEAKTFFRWCVRQKIVTANPLQDVSGQGRRHRGKPQLGLDESRKLSSCALSLARGGDQGAMMVLIALHIGLRAGEIINLRVRDLDDGGRLLWVRPALAGTSHLKNASAHRAAKVPTCLQPILRKLASKRPGQDLLFGLHWRDWPRKQVARLCELADVPKVTAHGLRGMKSTIALLAGEDADVVARSLGHTSSRVTFANYAAPGTREKLEQQRLEKALRPNRKGPTRQ